MNIAEINEQIGLLHQYSDLLFCVKGGIYHGECDGKTADNALALVMNGIDKAADKISEAINGGDA